MIGPNVNIKTEEHKTGIEARKAHRRLKFMRLITIGDDY